MLDTVSLVDYLIARAEEIESGLSEGWIDIPGNVILPSTTKVDEAYVLGMCAVYRAMLGELASGRFNAKDINAYII